MGLSVAASLAIHAAVILLIPIASSGTLPIYPVEFGEIEQTFEAPRAGSPDGEAVTISQPEVKTSQPAGPADGQETSVTVKPAPKPAPRPEPKPAPKPAPKPEPAPKPKPEPKPVPKPAPKETQPPAAKDEPLQGTAGEPGKPSSQAASTEPATAGQGTAAAGTAGENVLTGKSHETVPASPAGAAQGAAGERGEGGPGAAGPPTPAEPPAPAPPSAPGEAVGPAEAAGPVGPGVEPGAPAGPPKPKGEEFGTGRSLVLSGIPPVYPKNAQNEGVEGAVALSVTVDASGVATHVVVASGSGDPRLDEAAMRTVSRGWHFQAIGWPYELAVRVTFRKGSVELAFGGVTVLGD